MTARRATRSRRSFPWLILMGLALYAFVIWWVGWEAMASTLREAEGVPLAGMVGCIVAGFVVRIAKWRYALGPGLPIAPAFFLSKTAGSWSPARVGEFSPLVLRRFRTARVGVWIGADRILEAGMTLALGAWGLLAVGLLPWWLFSAFVVVGTAGSVLAFYAGAAASRRVGEARELGARMRKLVAFGVRVRDELIALGGKLPLLLIFTFAGKLLDLGGVILLYRAFGVQVGWALAAAVRGAHGVLSVLPDASGVPYVADAALLQRAAGAPPEVWSTAIGVEVAVLHGLLLAGLGLSAMLWRGRAVPTDAQGDMGGLE